MDEFLEADAIIRDRENPFIINSKRKAQESVECLINASNENVERTENFTLPLSSNKSFFLNVENCFNDSSKTDDNLPSLNQSKKGPIRWSTEEDNLLRGIVKKYGSKGWKDIAREFSQISSKHRSDIQCLHRYNKCLKPGLLKGPWSPDEDAIILNEVSKQKTGRIKWTQIAGKLCGRLGKQVRERWINHLNPDLKHTAWTIQEDFNLYKLQKEHGNKWKKLALLLTGRSENAVKNRFHSLHSLYQLPSKGEPIDEESFKNVTWLENRRIKKTRKYKSRRKSTRKMITEDCLATSLLLSSSDKMPAESPLCIVNDEYPKLELYNDEEAIQLPTLEFKKDKNKEKSKSWPQNFGIRIAAGKKDSYFPGIIQMTNIPSPFATTLNNSKKKRISACNKGATLFNFRNVDDTGNSYIFDERDLDIIQQDNQYNNNVSQYFSTTANITNCFGVVDQQTMQPVTFGIGNCFRIKKDSANDQRAKKKARN